MIWLTTMAFAGGFEVAQQDAGAAGAGHTGTARTDTAAAAWFNPAALADDAGVRVALGASVAASTIEAASLPDAAGEPWYARSEPGVSTPPYLYASYAQGPWAVGLAVNFAFAGGVAWPASWPQRFDIVSSKPQFARIAPSFAYSFGAVSVAAGLHVDAGSLRVEKATDHIAEEGYATLLLRGAGVGGDVAVLVTPSDRFSAGLSYKSRTRLPLRGEADFDVPDAFSPRFPDQGVAATWTLPDRIAGGVRYTAGPVTVLSDVSWTVWSVNDELVFDFDSDDTDDITQSNQWQDSLAVRLGGELTPHEAVVLRAGGYVDGLLGAPVPAQTLAPSSPDSRRIGATGGARWVISEVVAVDAYYEHLRLLRRDSASLDAPEAAYAGWAHVGGLGLTFGEPRRPSGGGPMPTPVEPTSLWDTPQSGIASPTSK